MHIQSLALIVGFSTLLASCGGADAPQVSHHLLSTAAAMSGLEQSFPDEYAPSHPKSRQPDAQCEQIANDMNAHRETVFASPQWQAFMASAAWTQLTEDLRLAEQHGCDAENASTLCQELREQYAMDVKVMVTTPEYAAANSLPLWHTLDEDYHAMNAHHCWDGIF